MIRQFFIFVVFLAFTQQVTADVLHLVLNGKAFHQQKRSFNEENWGLGFEYDFVEEEKWIPFVTGSFFKDSFSNTSTYFGGGSKRRFNLEADKQGWHIDVGVVAFLMTRKDTQNNKPFFGALPFVSLGTEKFAINATYIPSVSPKYVSLIFIQTTFKLAEW
jgi:hypothetical protein